MNSRKKAAAEVRKGNPPNPARDEDTKVTAEGTAKPVDGEYKSGDRSAGNNRPKRASFAVKHSKSRNRSSKKHLPVQESSSDSSSGDTDISSSSESECTESESESEHQSKKKRNAKKRSVNKDSPDSKGKKHKKLNKFEQAIISDLETGSDHRFENHGSDEDEYPMGQQDVTNQFQLLHLQQQLQQQQQRHLQHQQQAYDLLQQLGHGTRHLNSGLSPSTKLRPRRADVQMPLAHSRVRTSVAARRDGKSFSGRGRRVVDLDADDLWSDGPVKSHTNEKKRQKASELDYKRVDQVWDNLIHDFRLQDTAEGDTDAQYDDFLFHVRRTFDWEGKYTTTLVDIRSKLIRECLQEVMGNIKVISLVEETPKLDPNLLFLYLEDIRTYLKRLKKQQPSGADKHERKKDRKRLEGKQRQLKVLVKYIDKDYAEVKRSLYPLLENGLITFDLLWALWKPNTLAFTTTYGSLDEPRVFKVEVAEKHYHMMKGHFYYVDGKYLEFDGNQFGYGSISEELSDFRGARKINSLGCYPLKYHKNEMQLRKELIDRGTKFVALGGMHYKSHQGIAYYKKKKAVIKVNINGRIMVDPKVHRRINPNYPVSTVRPKNHDVLSEDEDEDEDGSPHGSGCRSTSDADEAPEDSEITMQVVKKLGKDVKGQIRLLYVPKEADDDENSNERLDRVPSKGEDAQEGKSGDPLHADEIIPPEFSDEDYLIASPVVLGFAFAEKLWLELTVSGVKEIQWNEHAYESLVLEPKTKDIVKALVESHKYHAAESIDDVIQGKGKGLVAVLHGPPGTGKTLTAEGISELLKCPLYMASAGELGTDSRFLEVELQKILDVCHAWGAILLLDEADVFLEKRNIHDIHRNALVSIFLRQLEYFQGILFLTTNRVETFDDAFQSRIHIALRYDSLDQKAKKTIFKIFIERVRVLEKIDHMPFTEEDYDTLSRHELNGRQIKNTVRTAQALAVNKGEPLSMNHIRLVLEVQMSFDRDLKGGTGYQDAMRSYS